MVNVPAVMVIDFERMESIVRVSYYSYMESRSTRFCQFPGNVSNFAPHLAGNPYVLPRINSGPYGPCLVQKCGLKSTYIYIYIHSYIHVFFMFA